jgi:hypothetical protein
VTVAVMRGRMVEAIGPQLASGIARVYWATNERRSYKLGARRMKERQESETMGHLSRSSSLVPSEAAAM